MGVKGPVKCVKYLLVIFNCFFFLLGCVLIGIGVWGEIKLGPYVELTNISFITGPRILIGVGVAIAVITLLGCCGSWKENKCMLSLYLVCLVILLGLEIAAGALAYENRDKLKSEIESDIKNQIQKYPGKNLKAINDLQTELKCCGSKDYNDWKINTSYNQTAVPDSCCTTVKQDCGTPIDTSKIYTEGCYSKLMGIIDDNLSVAGALALTMLFIQLLGLIFAVVLIWKI